MLSLKVTVYFKLAKFYACCQFILVQFVLLPLYHQTALQLPTQTILIWLGWEQKSITVDEGYGKWYRTCWINSDMIPAGFRVQKVNNEWSTISHTCIHEGRQHTYHIFVRWELLLKQIFLIWCQSTVRDQNELKGEMGGNLLLPFFHCCSNISSKGTHYPMDG